MTTVALLIDMQADFFGHQRLTLLRPALAAHTNTLTAMARSAAIPIVWVRQEFAPDLSDASLEVRRTQRMVVIAGTPGADLLPELDVHVSDHFVLKKRYSAFFGTNLDDLLRQLDCDQLIVAGVNTHACVRTTVVDAYQRDYEVILAKDCIDSLDREHHEVTWRYMDGKLGRGMTNEEIRAWIPLLARGTRNA
ncbi:nicotinamidase-related amidase [Luteibacter sp. OK325]|uniref:cysteine hydrolase family protein n=1 Tax=Luteibacter sp. OK325 TaxID=2135670 RepID=UPI000D383980|nr:isochorismatase family cysteine hydrolase [Luteibacter sp. OK325]PTR32870.1 nicotinamidase-related amidase [Luteibacter sp. OK325]